MRTTMNTVYAKSLANLNKLTSDMADINTRLSSGRSLNKISDNPMYMVGALNLRSSIAEISQYEENLQYGNTMISASEHALIQIKEQLIEAKVIAIQAQDPAVFVNLNSIAPKVQNLISQSVTLANTQINGKYIFGGFRTSGYSEQEPAPFIEGLIDGYRLNGNEPTPQTLIPQPWTVAETGAVLPLGALQFTNDAGTTDVPAINLNNGSTTNGLNEENGWDLRAAINSITTSSGVTASVTTRGHGTTSTNGATSPLPLTFDITGSAGTATVSLTGDGTDSEVAQQTIAAINDLSTITGVMAYRGNGQNGGITDSIVLRNVTDGDEGAITVANLDGGEQGMTGLTNGITTVGANNNTGQISLSSTIPFTFGGTTAATLVDLGLDNGTIAPSSLDPISGLPITYDFHENGTLELNDLKINGIWVPPAQDDGISTINPTISAAAKAAAINQVSDQTGVHAEITEATVQASGSVIPGTIGSGELLINGFDIFTTATTINQQDTDNSFIDAINARQGETGVTATRDSDGMILLKAIDGRNIHVESSANAETIAHLNGTNPATDSSVVYEGRVQLISERTYMLESSVFGDSSYEAGLIALGLDGGMLSTGEPTDQLGDGKVSALTIAEQDGNVRYAGDQHNSLAIKVGKIDKLEISQNGQVALKDTGVFRELQQLEDAMLGKNYMQVKGLREATNISATLNSGDTGLPEEEIMKDGAMTITVTDHDHQPPETFTIRIPVDVSKDSLSSISTKINGVPGINAKWDEDGHFNINSDDESRYTFALTDDTSNFSEAVRVTSEDMQVQAIDRCIADLDSVMETITTNISDFGARANRITVQTEIFSNLKLATQENLSEKQDTDFIKAVMDLKAKEVAYQAALSSTSKIMQLSLVDYLK